mmetsp:Transcript_11735/g.37300  ORF Transcript_11735/g.37300 Transcript_11735/m.37300 type:complete len:278 (+) Transcript_11735:194-1027(+)|eukprot:CAMPEP_0182881450 /NCGR_PEP_ID=MMETSP0034_2-20130328/17187_1 /TAXON_ID=156128 /ORGANISM="Nephroselmis pyriformis, Strain CCMP717" /LENGTH=277 /DNA_ID=CAMNT_0025014481 /DNA_START=182 /DNA_END=1015 /DNA_ORIENTATION=+
MASLGDIMVRTDVLVRRYEKYDTDKQAKAKTSKTDPFGTMVEQIAEDVDALLQKAKEAQGEKNRAVVATINAELRRAKNTLLTIEIDKLKKAIKKGKGVNKEVLAQRRIQIQQLEEAIAAVPDGVTSGAQRRFGRKKGADGAGPSGHVAISVPDASDLKMSSHENPLFYQETEESKQFAQEAKEAEERQDLALDEISHGLGILKNMGQDMSEELNRQQPLIDDIESKLDQTNKDLRSQNAKLKGMITKIRSSRNFCIDIILICIFLGIGAYIYNLVK